ncbi:MAG: metallophosphoesterase [Oscillospiraceae bacterium]|nr:metallophosphoesterase [Oscillospiraceae bacterium]
MAEKRKKKRKKRRGCLSRLLTLALVIAALAAFYNYSNHSIQVEKVDFTSRRLPALFDGYRIVQISDLHGAEFGEDNEKLLHEVKRAKPDCIVLTGDLVDQHRGADYGQIRQLATALSAIAPSYFVTGNHEWAVGSVPELKALLTECGVGVLSNEYVTLTKGNDSIVLAGIDDPNGYADQKTPEALAAEIAAAEGEPFWILLAHRNNRFREQYSLLGADLTISGHGHGGLIRLPFTDGLISTDRTLFPTHTDGFYEDNGATVFVSRGLGNSGITRRLFNRPQLAVLTLRYDVPSSCVADG